VADASWVEQEAGRLFSAHQIAGAWSFRFDRATTRLGQCDHRTQSISVSRYLTKKATADEVTQVLLHEIAHALAGPRAAHGPKWRAIAREIGYEGGRTHTVEPAHDRAKWVGECPSGHEIVRFRRPAKPVSCAKCDRSFNTSYLISWRAKT
jgi:SprT protein